MANIEYQRTNGDFRVDSAGNITLATQYLGGGPGIYNGTVTILGNLLITGSQTTIQTNNVDIKDRILTLNKGETGAGVALNTSGLAIDRGTATIATLLWDETQYWTYNGVTNNGMWTTKVGVNGAGLLTNAIRTVNGANLSLLGAENPTAVLTVEGTVNYQQHVTNINHIPNKGYVDTAIFSQPDRSRIQIFYQTSSTSAYTDPTSQILVLDSTTPNVSPAATEPQIRFQVNSNQWSTMYGDRFDIGKLRLTSTTDATPQPLITTNTTGVNIVFKTLANSGSTIKPDVELQAPLKLVIDTNYNSTTPPQTTGSIKIYSKAQGAGGTGIFFVNSQNTRDEIPSKRRAFVASLVL